VGKLAKQPDAGEVARALYLTALSRAPTADEAAAVAKHLGTPGATREELCRDAVWALISASEFRFNH
jgi:hypothetical protein